MNLRLKNSVTLLELIIAIALLSVIVFGFTSIDLFSRHHVITSNRRAKLQNEASFVLEHMTKEISRAIGDVNNNPITIEDSNRKITVYIDANRDGQRNDDGNQIVYQYDATNYQIQYYNPYSTSTPEVIAKKISACNFTHNWDGTKENFISVEITACWDPANSDTCGTPDNPSVIMQTRIKMPSVSIQ